MKRRLKRIFCAVLVFILVSLPKTARADFWGGDLPLLASILANSIQQLAQLRSLLGSGRDTLGLIKNINQGINDSLNLFKTIFPDANPGIYSDWQRAQDAIKKLQELYGIVIPSKDAQIQKDLDQSVSESVSLNNSIYKYTQEIDAIGSRIESYSHQVSPGGAQKLTAQALGVMLHVMNQSLRAQATGLKLQAQTMAVQNKKEKDMTRKILSDGDTLKSSMQSEKVNYQMPRF